MYTASVSFHVSKGYLLALALVIAAACCLPNSVSRAQTAPADEITNPVAVRVQEILGVKATDTDLLPRLAAAIESFSAPQAQRDTITRALVDVLNAGTNPHGFAREYYPRVTFAGKVHYAGPDPQDATWKYGAFAQRSRLFRFLWNRSKTLQNDDPDAAMAYARAAFLLAGQTDHMSRAHAFCILGRETADFIRIARLTDEQARQVEAFFNDWQQLIESEMKTSRPVMLAYDRILELKPDEPIPQAVLGDAIDALEQWRQLLAERAIDPSAVYDVIEEAWMLRNLGVVRKEDRAIDAVDAFFARWKQDTHDVLILRWITEAQEHAAIPPMDPRIINLAPPSTQPGADPTHTAEND